MSQAVEVLARLQPSVLHTHQIGALWYLGRAAKQIGGIPVLHTEHGNHLDHAKSWLHGWKSRLFWYWAGKAAGRFCCVSDEIAQAVARWHTIPKRKIHVVINGVRTEGLADRSPRQTVRRELGIPAEAPVIGSVGRLSEIKRQTLLLQAMAGLTQRFPAVRLLLVGAGPERERLEQEASDLGIRDRVYFAGYQAEPGRYLQAMDVFALSSRSEGLPIALLEAWAAGLPVVSSAVGGIPKTVTHGENGLLFASGDVVALGAALALPLNEPSLASRLGRAGQRTVEAQYSVQRMANDYERHYECLLAARDELN